MNRRPCEITTQEDQTTVITSGWFHCWEHFSALYNASPLRGGHPGGCVSRTYALVELQDGTVKEFLPSQIKFTDTWRDK